MFQRAQRKKNTTKNPVRRRPTGFFVRWPAAGFQEEDTYVC